MSKKYGLIVPDKTKSNQPVFQASRNVFGEDSDSDNDKNTKKPPLRPSDNTNRQAKITQDKAVMEDPTVYQYDEIYDSMVTKKQDESKKSKEVRQPKYIETLLKTANKRKIENERRIERQIQKEREKEGDEFADKEVFVTTAYKKKLEEMREEEEREKREEYLENIGDVTKQRDLGGFYRHLYEQKLGSDKEAAKTSEGPKKDAEIVSDKAEKNDSKNDKSKKVIDKKARNYRRRKSSDSKQFLSEGEIEDSDDEINRANLDDIKAGKRPRKDIDENIDADSDFSIDESSDEEDQNAKKPVEVKSTSEQVTNKSDEDKPKESIDKDKVVQREKKSKEKGEPKPKVDIWKKRTVGAVFEDALRRYYERKAARRD